MGESYILFILVGILSDCVKFSCDLFIGVGGGGILVLIIVVIIVKVIRI